MLALVIVLSVVVGLLSVLVVGLLRSHAEILQRLHEHGITIDDDHVPNGASASSDGVTSPVEFTTRPGVAMPRTGDTPQLAPISGVTPGGRATSLAVSDVDHRTLLVFLTSGCLTCKGFWDALAEPDLELPDRSMRLVIVTRGLDSESPSAVADLAPANVTTVMSSDAWNDYEVPVAPYVMLLDGTHNHVAGEGAALQWSQVASLLDRAVNDQATSAAAPELDLRNSGPDAIDRINAELRAAGIVPGHDSLFPDESAPDQ